MKITSAFLSLLAITAFSVTSLAQDDDGIYDDIYETPSVEEEIIDTSAPLDGYSTVDDYYPEGGYGQNTSTEPYSEQYVDENGNNITNNYYGDYYEDDDDYFYSSRIRRFHRANTWGYYDPWYTNMYYYNYDPFYWGTSIYIGYRPSFFWNWNYGWGWNYSYGWGGPSGYPACYGGYGYNNYWNWNGYNDPYLVGGYNSGLAYGYYNTFDSGSGIYYGHRGSGDGSITSLGSGYRSKSFGEIYTAAALEGKVSHANLVNSSSTVNGKPVGSLQGFNDRRFADSKPGQSEVKSPMTKKPTSNVGIRPNSDTRSSEIQSREVVRNPESRDIQTRSPYQRPTAERAASKPTRLNPNNVDRSRVRNTSAPRPNTQSASRANSYQRNGSRSAVQGRQQSTRPSSNQSRGNMYQDVQRTRPSSNDYTRPSRSGSNTRSNDYRPPTRTNTQPSRNATRPSRNATRPSRPSTPSRSSQPSRSVNPNRGGASNKTFSTPSRSSGSGSGRSSSGGSSTSGSRSKSGRP